MRNLVIGLAIGLMFSTYCIAKEHIVINPMQTIHTDRNFIYTTKVTTDEGTYRIFTFEGQNGSGGITAVKIK